MSQKATALFKSYGTQTNKTNEIQKNIQDGFESYKKNGLELFSARKKAAEDLKNQVLTNLGTNDVKNPQVQRQMALLPQKLVQERKQLQKIEKDAANLTILTTAISDYTGPSKQALQRIAEKMMEQLFERRMLQETQQAARTANQSIRAQKQQELAIKRQEERKAYLDAVTKFNV